MKSRRLFREACSLGTILLSHKCFKFLSFCLQNFWQPRAEGEYSWIDTDSPLLGKVRPGQYRDPEASRPSLSSRKVQRWGGLFSWMLRSSSRTPQEPGTPLPLSSLAPTVASHSAIGLSQGSCWLLVYRPSPGDQRLVHVGTNASTLLPSRMSLRGRPMLRAPAEC